MQTISKQIKKEMAKTIRCRIRETNPRGMSGGDFKKEIMRLLDGYINSII